MIVMAATDADRQRVARDDARIEARTLREETAAAGRYLRLIGGRIAHLVVAEQDLAAVHLAHEVIRLGERMERRGAPEGGTAA